MPASRSRLFLIDGSSYIYRAFFALPPLTNPGGMPTNAVYGFTTMILKLLADARAEHLVVVFDAPGRTFRDEIYDSYKANRPATPDDLAAQIPLVHKVVAGFRLPTLAVAGVEADDVIATLATRFAADGVECVIVTGDKDLMQLVGPRVKIWDTMRDRRFDEAAVTERWGVAPAQIVDVMALMGDSIDNIPGVKGIGEKTAVALVRQFGDLESMLRRLPEVERMELRGAKKVAARLGEDAELARTSRKLASMRYDVDVACELETFRMREPDVEALRALFTQLGFHSLLKQVSVNVPVLEVATAVAAGPRDVAATLARAGERGCLAIATVMEPGPHPTAPACDLLLCADTGSALRVSIADPTLRPALAALAEPAFEVIGHDLKREALCLAAAGIDLDGAMFDLMIASYLVDATATHGLEDLASNLLGAHLAGFREGAEGAAAGAALMPKLAAELKSRLKDMELERLFEEIEMPLVRVLAHMERRGIAIDVPYLRAMGVELSARLDALIAEIYELAGGEFNLNSPPQLRVVLFERMQLSTRGVRKGKTGYSTDVDVLTKLAVEHPLPAKILEYRALSKLKTTYVDALQEAVHPVTGRLHTRFNQTVAATGRLSSSEPNLQNVPIRGEEGRRIRKAFVAPPGRVLIAADYSQIELRVLAHMCGDPVLIAAFASGEDIHRRTAADVFRVESDAVTADMRRVAKVINFGVLYGMGPQRLAQELGISHADAQAYIASYFERYPRVREFMRGIVETGRERGYVATILGRRRPVPELRSPDRAVVQAAERAAANTPIQGSAADIIKLAMVAVDRRLGEEGLDAFLILQVHDELLIEAAEADRVAASEVVREQMEGALPLTVPLRVDLAAGRTWEEVH